MKPLVCLSVMTMVSSFGLINTVYSRPMSSESTVRFVAEYCSGTEIGNRPLQISLRAGLCRDTNVRKQRYVIEQREADIEVSRSTYWPKLAVSAGADRVSKSVKVPDARYADYRLLGNSGQGSINLEWMLFDSGYTNARVDSDIARTKAAGNDYVDAVLSSMIENITAYFRYMNAYDALLIARDAVSSAEKISAQATGQFRAGVGTVADYQFALANVAQTHVGEDEAFRDLNNARTELLALVGVGFDFSLLESAANAKYTFPELPPEEVLVDHAITNSPKLGSILFQIEAAKQQIQAARASALPTVSLNASRYTNLTPPDTSSVEQRIQGWAVGVRLSIPIFDGFASSGNASSAAAQMSALQSDQITILRNTRKDVHLSYNDVQFGKRKVKSYESLVDHNAASLTAAKARYKAGVGPLTDVLKAESDFFSNSVEQVRAQRLITESSLRLFVLTNGVDALLFL